QSELSGDLTPPGLAGSILVNEWLLLDEARATGLDQQIAIRRDAHPVGASEREPDSARVRARLEHKVILQAILVSVIDDVHSRIDLAVPNAGVTGHPGPPILAFAQVIVSAGRQLVESFDVRRAVRMEKRNIHPL